MQQTRGVSSDGLTFPGSSEPIDWSRLQAPFSREEIEWRVQRAGKNKRGIWAIVVPYITARAIHQRLDEVVGPWRWQLAQPVITDKGVVAGIGIRVGEEWVWRWGEAPYTDVEALKGAASGAQKRAAVAWGIGRYLYGLEDSRAHVHEDGAYYGKLAQKDGGDPFRWDPPALPAWALPQEAGRLAVTDRRAEAEKLHRQLGAMLAFIRAEGKNVKAGTTIRANGGREVDFAQHVRDNWQKIKADPELALSVVRIIERETSIAFTPDEE